MMANVEAIASTFDTSAASRQRAVFIAFSLTAR